MQYSTMIIDDHPIIHDGLRTLLANEESVRFIEGAFSAESAMEQLEIELPDLAIVDLSLGDSDGTYMIQRVKAKYPKLKILIYSMSEETLFAERTASAGAVGYVMKTAGSDILKESIMRVLNDQQAFSPEIQERINKTEEGKTKGLSTLVEILSNREMDVFKLVGQGLSSVKIAAKLNISRNTVDTHRINVKNKLEQPNGKALDRLAYDIFQNGLEFKK